MTDNFNDEDVRIKKTNGALIEAMSKLLDLRNFNQITVKDLCGEARIGRATFYSHFQDKYDLLRYWLTKAKAEIVSERVANKDAEKRIGDFVNDNRKRLAHLIEGANSETLGLLSDFILSLLDMDKNSNTQDSRKHMVLSIFCCGGIANYLQWQAKSNSISDLALMNSCFYSILDTLHKWSAEYQ